MVRDRGVSPVIATVLMLALVVVLATSLAVTFNDVVTEAKDTNERPIPVSDNYLSNADFEDGTVGAWEDGLDSSLPAGVVVRDNASSGQYALRMDSSPDFVGQDVTDTLRPGRIYRLCAHSKVADLDSTYYVGVQYYDGPDPATDSIIEKATYKIEWTEYEERCVLTDFTTDQPVESAEVWVFYENGTDPAYVDELSLREVRYFADPDEDTDDV